MIIGTFSVLNESYKPEDGNHYVASIQKAQLLIAMIAILSLFESL